MIEEFFERITPLPQTFLCDAAKLELIVGAKSEYAPQERCDHKPQQQSNFGPDLHLSIPPPQALRSRAKRAYRPYLFAVRILIVQALLSLRNDLQLVAGFGFNRPEFDAAGDCMVFIPDSITC